MRKKPKNAATKEDLTASEISEDRRWEGASESGHTTDADDYRDRESGRWGDMDESETSSRPGS